MTSTIDDRSRIPRGLTPRSAQTQTAQAPGLRPGGRPLSIHVIAKPIGPVCNLACRYCFYLEKKDRIYPEVSAFRMSGEVLEQYTRQYIEAQQVPEVTFGWQGGEPTLLGVEFFERALELQQRYRRPGLHITNTLQTNGILLDEPWCRFLAHHDFLVGLSLDGPRDLHDRYRTDKTGGASFEKVVAALRRLQAHRVETNVLCVVSRANAGHPLEVYDLFRSLGVRHIQFIPAVAQRGDDPDGLTLHGAGGRAVPAGNGSDREGPFCLADHAVSAEAYGRFLCAVFDEWVRRDVGRIHVQIFEVTLQAWLGVPRTLCVFAPTCGQALALEHNGDLYSCDHYVYPRFRLGNITERELRDLALGQAQQRFGRAKRDALPAVCRECDVRFACHGGCPKNRFAPSPAGQPGLNVLCDAYLRFFRNTAGPMRFMAEEVRAGRPAARVISWMNQGERRPPSASLAPSGGKAARNAPCPCGSGRKYKHCCGAPRPA